jgi:TolB protein
MAVWSPDGSKIAFAKYNYLGWNVYVMNGDGSGQQLIGPGYEPSFSPDGTKVAFVGQSINSVLVANVDGTNVHQLSDSGYADGPSWSPDGSKIAFVYSPGNQQDDREIWTVNATGCNIGVYFGPGTTAGSVSGATIYGANYYGVVVNAGHADVTKRHQYP